jgi:hypothetical protein
MATNIEELRELLHGYIGLHYSDNVIDAIAEDIVPIIAAAEARGVEKGRAEGIEEGAMKERELHDWID